MTGEAPRASGFYWVVWPGTGRWEPAEFDSEYRLVRGRGRPGGWFGLNGVNRPLQIGPEIKAPESWIPPS